MSTNILLVDDSSFVRQLLERTLRRGGYTVAHAHHGRDAYMQISGGQVHPDLILTDVQMPYMTGPQLILQLRDAGFSFPIILMSGDAGADLSHVNTLVQAGYATKFVSKDHLHSRINQVVWQVLHP